MSLITLAVAILLFISVNIIVIYKSKKYKLRENTAIPVVDALIVLGAHVYDDGRLCDILKDRLDTALEILQNSENTKIIVTGDHGRPNYDEVNAMRKYLEEKGINTSNIFMDHAGFSTYESIYRAKDIFEVRSAIIVTQDYHLKRALYLGRRMGIKAYGVAADKRTYLKIVKYRIRESIARCKDFIFVNTFKPKPKFLGERIPINTSSGISTHDK